MRSMERTREIEARNLDKINSQHKIHHQQLSWTNKRNAQMELKVFSIRDSKGEIYLQPFFNKSHGEAERNFRELVKDEKSMVTKETR